MSQLLRSIPARALVEIVESDKKFHAAVQAAKSKSKKADKTHASNTDARKLVHEEIQRIAGKILIEKMSKEQRAEVTASLNIDHEAAGNNPKSSVVQKKRLLEAAEDSIEDLLKNHVNTEAIVALGELFGLELGPKAAHDQLVAELTNAIEYEAVRSFLESLPNNVLLDVAFEMKLCPATESAANATIAEAILTQTEVAEIKKPVGKKEPVKISKTKPKIAKGVSYDDLFHWYQADELKLFAKENDLIQAGNKKQLIKRILAWLDGDKENTTHEGKEAKKASKKAAKESNGAGATKKAAGSSKKAAAAAAPAVEEPADDLLLDLDNLNQYDIATLKAYCQVEEIKVKGTKKANYIKAIEDYNNEPEDGGQ